MAFTYQTIIKAAPEAVLDALTNPAMTQQYYYGFSIEGDWREGGRYAYTAGGNVCIEGTVTELVPGKKIAMTFKGLWDPKVAEDPESTVSYELAQEGENTYLKLTHDGLPEGSYSAQALPKGWANILSGLKTLLETGSPLVVDMQATMRNL